MYHKYNKSIRSLRCLYPDLIVCVFLSSKRAVDESEMEAAERRGLRCVWVTGGRALTEQEAAMEIVTEARLLLQEDLAQLGIQWDPATLPPEVSAGNNSQDMRDSSSASNISSHQTHVHNSGGEQAKASESRDVERHEEESREERISEGERGNVEDKKEEGKPEEEQVENKQIGDKDQVERKASEEDRTSEDVLTVSDKKSSGTKIEKQKQTEEKEEESNHKINLTHRNPPLPERGLTQELAEILSSPLLQPTPHPQLPHSPMPPPRFRAPVSRVEEQHQVTSREDNTTRMTVSPVQSGRLKHSRALSKVLHSIQMDKGLQDNVEAAQTSHSTPTVGQNFEAAGQAPTTVPSVSTPANTDMITSPASVPLFSPEAKRRRIHSTEVDRFSSPELYAGNEREEQTDGEVKKGEDSFGESFELDTQTERIIVQQAEQHGDGNNKGISQLAETVKIREEETMKEAVGTEKNMNDDRGEGPRFNVSLTDSQMELILNTSQHVSGMNNPSW